MLPGCLATTGKSGMETLLAHSVCVKLYYFYLPLCRMRRELSQKMPKTNGKSVRRQSEIGG